MSMIIVGPRQAGKTFIAVAMAVETAVLGGKVLFQGGDRKTDHQHFLKCLERAEWLYRDQIKLAHRANGAQDITFTSGGLLAFHGRAFDYWADIDLHIIDDCNLAESLPNAKRSLKTVTI